MSYLRYSVRLNLQLFVGGLMSYLRYLCLFSYSGVQHTVCCVFVLGFFVLCSSMFSGLFILDCPFGFVLCFCHALFVFVLCRQSKDIVKTRLKGPSNIAWKLDICIDFHIFFYLFEITSI